jgi:hypothetical protein
MLMLLPLWIMTKMVMTMLIFCCCCWQTSRSTLTVSFL